MLKANTAIGLNAGMHSHKAFNKAFKLFVSALKETSYSLGVIKNSYFGGTCSSGSLHRHSRHMPRALLPVGGPTEQE